MPAPKDAVIASRSPPPSTSDLANLLRTTRSGRRGTNGPLDQVRGLDERARFHPAAPRQVAAIFRDPDRPVGCEVDEVHVAAPSPGAMRIPLQNASDRHS